ncbi:hypothetical protein PR048_026367 [Dryococelus australis]|uniref:Uncharacterized protein n=1 Tax=Dryococelus australis TaxID=614101 RepID=A0ABQ9GL40_9NEOP|nr:hypothetical protein PR048_026367 [Dryococelus australis]
MARGDNTAGFPLRKLQDNPWSCKGGNLTWLVDDGRNSSVARRVVDRDKTACGDPQYRSKPLLPVMAIFKVRRRTHLAQGRFEEPICGVVICVRCVSQAMEDDCPRSSPLNCSCTVLHIVWKPGQKNLVPNIVVNCSNLGLTELPHTLPANTTTLHVKGNKQDIQRAQPSRQHPRSTRFLRTGDLGGLASNLRYLECSSSHPIKCREQWVFDRLAVGTGLVKGAAGAELCTVDLAADPCIFRRSICSDDVPVMRDWSLFHSTERPHCCFTNKTDVPELRSGKLARLPPTSTGFNPRMGHSRIFAWGNRAGRRRWSASFLEDRPSLHSGAAPHSPHSPSSASQDFAAESRPTRPSVAYGGRVLQISNVEPLVSNPIYRTVLDIYLDGNGVKSLAELEGSRWLANFRALSLRHNQLAQLPSYALDNALQKNNNALMLLLGGNPWRCDCVFTPAFQDLLMKYTVLVKDVADVKCSLVEGDENSMSPIRELSRTSVCIPPSEYLIQPLDLLNAVLASLIVLVVGWVFMCIPPSEYLIQPLDLLNAVLASLIVLVVGWVFMCIPPSEYLIQPLDLLNAVLASLIVLVVGKLIYDYWTFKKTGNLPWILTKMF